MPKKKKGQFAFVGELKILAYQALKDARTGLWIARACRPRGRTGQCWPQDAERSKQIYHKTKECHPSIMPSIHKTLHNLAVSTTSDPSKILRPPNRMTTAFNAMKKTCPDAIRTYATCVATQHQLGDLEKGSCQDEFAAVKKCFQSVRQVS